VRRPERALYYVCLAEGASAARYELLREAMQLAAGDYSLYVVRPRNGDGESDAPAGAAPRVRVVTNRSRPELESLIAGSRGLVSVAEGAAAYGPELVDAMARAKPVIVTSDAGGAGELVQHGANGLVVEPTAGTVAAALDSLARDPVRARRLGDGAQAGLERAGVTWARVAEALVA
jgi:glycosyltransferase involved in cell wall biosynthesis